MCVQSHHPVGLISRLNCTPHGGGKPDQCLRVRRPFQYLLACVIVLPGAGSLGCAAASGLWDHTRSTEQQVVDGRRGNTPSGDEHNRRALHGSGSGGDTFRAQTGRRWTVTNRATPLVKVVCCHGVCSDWLGSLGPRVWIRPLDCFFFGRGSGCRPWQASNSVGHPKRVVGAGPLGLNTAPAALPKIVLGHEGTA